MTASSVQAGSVRLDFGLTSPHHVNSPAAASSYGNLSVFNPREDHLDTASADEPTYSPRLRFKNRFENCSTSVAAKAPQYGLRIDQQTRTACWSIQAMVAYHNLEKNPSELGPEAGLSIVGATPKYVPSLHTFLQGWAQGTVCSIFAYL